MMANFNRDDFRALLNTRGYLQAELADRIGVSQSAVSSYFAGRSKPSKPILKRMAEALNVDVSELLSDEEGDVVKAQAVAEEAPSNGGISAKKPMVIESVAPKENAPKTDMAQKKEELICSALETATELLKIASEILKDIRAKEATK